MYFAHKFARKNILLVIWIIGSIALIAGLPHFPWITTHFTFIFMALSFGLFGISTLRIVLRYQESDASLVKHGSRLVVAYSILGLIIFLMQYLSLMGSFVAFAFAVCGIIFACWPFYSQIYYKIVRKE